MKKLMIVGTFHMESQNDVKNVENLHQIHDRTEELELLIKKLAEYRPTKIFVEYEKTEQASLNELYDRYGKGKLTSTNEIVKVAFPLAEKTKAEIFAVDWMEQGAAIRGCGDVMDELNKYPSLKAEIERYETVTPSLEKGILESLRVLNSKEEVEKSKAYYINYARIGVDDYFGMGWLIWWYQRNMNIFANISDRLEENDRALLIIGAAHKGILEEFFKDSRSVELVDSLEYM